ncbi:putative transposase-associated domain-containing protein [Tanacetum coccineum]
MNFASDIPIDGSTTIEMVTKDNFDEDDLVKFQELLLDAEKTLYEGCPDFTKLSTIVKIFNLKGKYGASDKFFTELLGLIKKMLPAGNEMVEKTYQAKKVMKLIGSGYKKIHVCINNCLLYWKDDKDLTAFQTCRISRWKVDNKTHKVYKNILVKAWRTIDEKFPKIAEDTRNLRLGISADGVDVNTGNRHHRVDTYDASTKDNFNLRVVVLWTINDYPALGTLCGCPYSRFKGCVVCGKDTNCVRLSASSKQSYVGHRRYLPYNHPFRKQKKAFNGQQEFLQAPIPMTGEQIYNEVKHIENKWGKGKRTNNNASENQEDTRGRGGKIQKQKRNTTEEEGSSSQVNGQNGVYWKKFNIWYRKLKYWRHNPVPHCIDFMHVEKNVAESIVGTLLHVPGKTKDGLNARLDLAELGVKPELFAMQDEDKTTLPPAGYTLTNAEKDIFCETLHNIKVPEGYCSNFSSLVNLKDRKLIGLKSHDYHMLMQEFLPIAIRSIMHPPTRYAIIRFCFFFKSICSKEIILQELDKMQAELTIAEEITEFFSEYHKSMETIGIPPDKHETDENEEGKPLSAGKSSEVSAKLFQKAHLYVIHNTDEIVPYIERQKQVLKTENPGKRIAFLENEHSKSFAKCLRKEVERELAISKRKCIRNIIVVNLDSSSNNNNSDSYSTSKISTSEEIDYDSPEPPKSLLKWYHYLSDEYKDNGRFWGFKSGCNESDVKPSWKDIKKAKACKTFGVQIPPTMTFAEVKIWKRNLRKIIVISSDSSKDRKGASKATAPIFYGPSTQGLLDAYGYNTIEEYLSWNYFSSIDNESTNMETIDKRNTDKDCIVDSNSAMSKANVTTWDEIEKKMGAMKSKTCADKAKGKRKVSSCTLHLQLAYAHCICTLHLQLAFASKHLHIAFAG